MHVLDSAAASHLPAPLAPSPTPRLAMLCPRVCFLAPQAAACPKLLPALGIRVTVILTWLLQSRQAGRAVGQVPEAEWS